MAAEDEDGKVEHRISGWFAELSSRRSSNGFSPNPISYSEIDAWIRLTGRLVLPSEVALLCRIDSAFLAALAKNEKPDG